jgi:hypothetical protein
MSRTVSSRLLLAALVVAALLGWAPPAAIAADHHARVAQPTTTGGTWGADQPTTTAAPSTTAAPTSGPATSASDATSPAGSGATPAGPGGEGSPAATGPDGAGTTAPSGGAPITGGGARAVVEELVRGRPGEAARRAVESAVRELGDLSPAELVLFGLLVLFALALTAIAVTSLWWMLHAWRTPASLLATGFPTSDTPPRHSFSLSPRRW